MSMAGVHRRVLACEQGLGRVLVTHSFNAYLVSFYYVTGSALRIRNTVIHSQRPFPYESV